jgi:ABC-type branched-subunit amino acid transport system ATPase component/ABC-type branched-subunit amino acid transport system permease subunit
MITSRPYSSPTLPTQNEGVTPNASHSSWLSFWRNDSTVAGFFIILISLFPYWSSTPHYAAQTILLGAIYVIAILGLDFVVGYAGALSIGHAALFGIGAYTAGALTTLTPLPGWLCLPIGALTAAATGWLMSLSLLRANDKYVALGTLVFGLAASVIFSEWSALTGGSVGLSLPHQRWFGIDLNIMIYTYLALGLVILSLQVVRRLTQSAIGRAFEALRDAPIAAECMGIHVTHYKQAAFIMAGAFAGLAGALFALSQGYIAPSSFNFEMSVTFLLALMLGGKKRLLGSLLGASIVIYLPLMLAAMHEWKPVIYGCLILFANYALPEGIISLIPKRTKQWAIPSQSHCFSQETIASPHHHSALPLNNPLLRFEKISVSFGRFRALNHVSFAIQTGTIVGIIGPNGAGKSTLINVLTGIYAPSEGAIYLNQSTLTGKTTSAIAQAGIARTFQNLQIFCGLSVFENILVGLHHAHEHHPLNIALGLHHTKDQQAYARAWALLNLVGLNEQAHLKANHLSYGQKRFLEIARALACNPTLLLLDEPAAGMHGEDLNRLKTLILTIKQRGITVLMIEHHMDILTTLSDRMVALNFGEHIAEGTPAEVTTHPAVKEAYLGS